MGPILATDYGMYQGAANAEVLGNQAIAVASSPSVVLAYSDNLFNRQFGRMIAFTRKAPMLAKHVVNIIAARPFNNVARIKTWRVVAGMQAHWLRPMPIGNKEGDAVGWSMPNALTVLSRHFAMSISVLVAAKRPKQAFIGGVSSDGIYQPLKTGGTRRTWDILAWHRCSSMAAVFGAWLRPSVRHLPILLLLSMLGCAAKVPAPALPPQPSVFPITISPGMVGQRVMVQLGIAPPKFYVTCCLPKGMVVTANTGKLWLSGIPLQAGDFRFRITTTPPPVGTIIGKP